MKLVSKYIAKEMSEVIFSLMITIGNSVQTLSEPELSGAGSDECRHVAIAQLTGLMEALGEMKRELKEEAETE